MDWFVSYLKGRRQRVLANNVYSSYQTITQGVQQGSVLGPLVYILYANDVVNVVKNCNIASYADDTVLYTASDNFDISVSKIRCDISAMSGWCLKNGISMNTDKTKLMLFVNSKKKIAKLTEISIQVDNVPLHTVTNYKYPGCHS